MPNFLYELSYAGVPLLQDQAKVIRLGFNQGEPQGHPVSMVKHQPWTDLIEEVNKLINLNPMLNEFGLPPNFPGRNLAAIAHPTQTGPQPHAPTLPINSYYYPPGATRWSVFRGLATSSMVKNILNQLTQLSNVPIPISPGEASFTGLGLNNIPTWQPAHFVLKAASIDPNNPSGKDDNYKIDTILYMLPPRPLAEHGGQFDGLYLLTFVDERYYWQYSSISINVHETMTWDLLLFQIAETLNIGLVWNDIPAVYGGPEPDSQLWTSQENTGVLFDAIAANIGCMVIRQFDRSYQLWTPVDTQAVVQANLLAMAANLSPSALLSGTIQPGQTGYPTNPYPARTAGGDIFNSGPGTNLKVGDLTLAKNSVLPANGVSVAFPQYIQGDDPVPHFVNTRYQNQRPSTWYEESYGNVLVINVPLASGGGVSGGGWLAVNGVVQSGIIASGHDWPGTSLTSGLVGVAGMTHVVHSTAKALYSGEIQL